MKNLISILLLLLLNSCTKSTNYYTLTDYEKVKKIDTHIHITTNRDVFVEQAKKDNFSLLNIVVDVSKGEGWIKEQYDYCMDQKTRHPKNFEIATSFSMQKWDDPDWVENTMNWLNKNIEEGVVAVKVWKNIGMVFKDKNGDLVMIDDPKFDPIFNMLTEKNIAVVGHLGEPKNCWLPLDEMSVNNDKKYFKENPQYHMYKHPELPSYEDQMAARDRMLEKNMNLTFVGAHMGSMEWSVDELAKRLDKFPNMSVDLAARIGQIFYQTIEDREKVRKFFIKYQDRLLYATDLQDGGNDAPDKLKTLIHDTWILDWQFFVTDDIMTSDRVDEKFTGLKLPKDVVDKIYRRNAQKWLNMFPHDK